MSIINIDEKTRVVAEGTRRTMIPSENHIRIGIDAHVVTGKFQGTRTTLTNLLIALARLKPKHEIIIYTDDPDAAKVAIGPSPFSYRSLGHVGSIRRLLSTFPKILKDDQIDVAVFQYNTPLFCRAKRVVFIHDILPITHPWFFPKIMRWRSHLFFTISMLRAAKIIAISQYTFKSIQDHCNIPVKKLTTVLNGPSFPPSSYQSNNNPPPEKFILAVGRIESRKNIDLIIDAFLMANVTGVNLYIIGSTDLGYNYKIPDDPRIKHLTGIDDNALINMYAKSSLFVFASSAEGFGIPLLDALLFGIPCIASNRTAMAEIANDLAAMFDPDGSDSMLELANLIKGHFNDRPIAAPSSSQRKELYNRYNWDRAASDFIQSIEKIDV